MTKSTYTIKQAYYGSASGFHDYDILSKTSGLEKFLDRIKEHSNLAGSAQTADDPTTIYCFYPLDALNQQWAFAKTFFLGMEKRGNDYITHILIMESEFIDAFRWDVFLLEDYFNNKKPDSNSVLPEISIKIQKLEELSRQPLIKGVKKNVPKHITSYILKELSTSESNCLVEVDNMVQGKEVCESVFSALPPDDKKEFSFCSHYSYARHLSYRFIVYSLPDQSLVERYLIGTDKNVPIIIGEIKLDSMKNNRFRSWMLRVYQGLAPVSGISIFSNVSQDINKKPTYLLIKEHVKNQSTKLDLTFEHLERFYEIVEHPLNANLDINRSLSSVQIVDALVNCMNIAVNKNSDIDYFVNLYQKITRNSEDPNFFDNLFSLINQKLEKRTQKELIIVSTGIVICLLASPSPRIDLVYNIENNNAFLSSPKKGAWWINQLYEASHYKNLVISLLIAWIRSWRSIKGVKCLDKISDIIKLLSYDSDSKNLVPTLLTVLEKAAPSKDNSKDDRIAWFVALIHTIRPCASEHFQFQRTVRIVFNEKIFEKLHPNDLNELIPLFIEKIPEELNNYITATLKFTSKITNTDTNTLNYYKKILKSPDMSKVKHTLNELLCHSNSTNMVIRIASFLSSQDNSLNLQLDEKEFKKNAARISNDLRNNSKSHQAHDNKGLYSLTHQLCTAIRLKTIKDEPVKN